MMTPICTEAASQSAWQDGHTRLAHVLECVMIVIIIMIARSAAMLLASLDEQQAIDQFCAHACGVKFIW